jgi:hypothetical protein
MHNIGEGILNKSRVIIMFVFILLISFQLNAQTWSSSKRLTWNSGYSQAPSIAADNNGDLHLVWDDGTRGNQEIFYKNRK